VCCGIEGDVIPILFAARRCSEIVLLEQMVSALGYTSKGKTAEQKKNGRDGKTV
jgi:hypothetical protein